MINANQSQLNANRMFVACLAQHQNLEPKLPVVSADQNTTICQRC